MPRWGMVIDLDKCVGCQACTTACKAENNVPHGSPEEQKLRREIYWNKVIAVTTGKYPRVCTELIPMPCMHCNNPPFLLPWKGQPNLRCPPKDFKIHPWLEAH